MILASSLPDVTPLVVLNVALGVLCLAALVAVGVAVWLDLRERRRWRAMVPNGWPPEGVDPEDAYVAPAPPVEGRVEHQEQH